MEDAGEVIVPEPCYKLQWTPTHNISHIERSIKEKDSQATIAEEQGNHEWRHVFDFEEIKREEWLDCDPAFDICSSSKYENTHNE